MERLTKKRDGQWVIPLRQDGKCRWALTERGGMATSYLYGDHADRLAAYEDTGLTPEEVADLQRAWDMYGGEEGITALLATPPNTPLTLEELREICGKPVYIAGNFDDDNLDCSGWKVVKRIYDDEFIEFTDGIWLSLSRNYFGVDWRAYSCEPGARPREGEST